MQGGRDLISHEREFDSYRELKKSLITICSCITFNNWKRGDFTSENWSDFFTITIVQNTDKHYFSVKLNEEYVEWVV